jgi:hypothetical protein
MLRYKEINPLNVHGLRRVDHCPPHFLEVCFDLKTQEQNISDWIYTQLSGRFYYNDKILIDDQGKRSMCKVVAFERHSEATYFGLFIDQINATGSLW